MDNFDLKKYLIEKRIFKNLVMKEMPQKIDPSTLGNFKRPEDLINYILNNKLYTRSEVISAVSSIPKKSGLYFWFLTPKGALVWEEIIKNITNKEDLTLNYCTQDSNGNILVYVGIAANSLKNRLNWHIDIDKNVKYSNVSGLKKDGSKTAPSDSSMRSKIQLALIDPSTGRYTEENLKKYLKFIDDNMRFRFITQEEIEELTGEKFIKDEKGKLKKAHEAIEKQFTQNCILHFNDSGTPEVFKSLTSPGQQKRSINIRRKENEKIKFQ